MTTQTIQAAIEQAFLGKTLLVYTHPHPETGDIRIDRSTDRPIWFVTPGLQEDGTPEHKEAARVTIEAIEHDTDWDGNVFFTLSVRDAQGTLHKHLEVGASDRMTFVD